MNQNASDEPVHLYSVSASRELDCLTVAHTEHSSYGLMCAAGKAAFALVQQLWPATRQLLVISGKGNNGGDGYVLARLAAVAGIKVNLVSSCTVTELTGAAEQAYVDMALPVICQPELLPLDGVDLLVDGLLGIGLRGSVRPMHAQWIKAINQSSIPTLSLDVPSGLCADTGQVMGCAVKSQATISFITRKQGLYTAQARDYCGTLYFNDLSVPGSIYRQVPANAVLLQKELASTWLPYRARSGHKGCYGHVLVVAGNTGMVGAAVMASLAAARSGAG
jgi:NAD(P)H-hydrate epimerase